MPFEEVPERYSRGTQGERGLPQHVVITPQSNTELSGRGDADCVPPRVTGYRQPAAAGRRWYKPGCSTLRALRRSRARTSTCGWMTCDMSVLLHLICGYTSHRFSALPAPSRRPTELARNWQTVSTGPSAAPGETPIRTGQATGETRLPGEDTARSTVRPSKLHTHHRPMSVVALGQPTVATGRGVVVQGVRSRPRRLTTVGTSPSPRAGLQ